MVPVLLVQHRTNVWLLVLRGLLLILRPIGACRDVPTTTGSNCRTEIPTLCAPTTAQQATNTTTRGSAW